MTTNDSTETFDIPLDIAETYEQRFVPALFSEWADRIVDAAGIAQGMHVLDVACGTGIVTRKIAEKLDGTGSVSGVDANQAMLTVARRVCPEIEFRLGDVADLPFDAESFDVVTCSMAMFFFPDRRRAVSEMARVTKAGGCVAVVVPSTLDAQPAWKPFVEVAARHAGPEAVSLLSTYWACGDADMLRDVFTQAELSSVTIDTMFGTATFASTDAFVATEVESTPLIERIDDEVYRAILADSRRVLDPFTTAGGRVEAPIECHVATARKP